MNILLTGANGFVGYALYHELRIRQNKLSCVFRRFSEDDEELKAQFNDCDRYLVGDINRNTRWGYCLKRNRSGGASGGHGPYRLS